jgi:hypothetical protein
MRGSVCIQKIRDWLSTCKSQHAECIRYEESVPTLPTCVIDVGTEGSNLFLRLHHTQGEKVPYITLSHYWGISQHFVTTKRNLEHLQEEFRWDLLPATFQDAVLIIRKLGIKFLWIDSLCIIQDER